MLFSYCTTEKIFGSSIAQKLPMAIVDGRNEKY